MKKIVFLAAMLCFSFVSLFAQTPISVLLWPEGVPDSNGLTGDEKVDNDHIFNVTIPGMTVYLADPAKNTKAAVLICPGGGYSVQAAGHEGSQIAQWLSENGITGIVLKYRLPNKHASIPLKDAQQALRIIRSKATEWNINPQKVGISGFSAGGHLASTAGTHFDLGSPASCCTKPALKSSKKGEVAPLPLCTYSCRPDFMILFYPVISMKEGVTHDGSRNNLLGEGYNKDSVEYYSNELQVTKNTPPTLLLLSDDDTVVIPQNSSDFYAALKANGVKASMYIFPEGNHGWGFHQNFRYHENWKALCLDWLKQQKIVE